MTVTSRWLVEGHIALFHYTGDVTVSDLQYAVGEGLRYIEMSDALRVHFLTDGSQATQLPKNVFDIKQVIAPAVDHPRMGWVISYHLDQPMVKVLANLSMKFFRVRFRIMDTFDDAINHLREYEPLLIPLLEDQTT